MFAFREKIIFGRGRRWE